MKKEKIGFAGLQFLTYIAFSLCMSNIIPYLADLGYDSFERGLALSSYAVLTIVFQIVFGILSDHFHTSKKIVLTSLCLLGVLTITFFGKSQSLFLLMIFWVGCCGGLVNSLCGLIDTWIMSIGPLMANALSRLKVFGSIGWTVGSLLSSVIVTLLGFSGVGIAVFLFLVMALILCYRLPDMQVSSKRSKQDVNFKGLARNTTYLYFIIILFILYGLVVANTGLVVDKMLLLGASPFEISLKWAMGSLLEIPMYFYSMKLMNKFGNTKLLIFSSFILVIQFWGFAIASASMFIVILSSLQIFTTPVILMSSKFIIMRLVPEELQNSGQLLAMSLYMGGSSLVVPVLSGFISRHIGYNLTLMIYACLAMIAMVSLIWNRHRFNH